MYLINNQRIIIRNLIKWIIGVCLLLSAFFLSCRYKEGPSISFRSALNRIEGQYHVRKLIIDGLDYTQEYSDSCHCNFVFRSDDYYNYGELELKNCRSISNRNNFSGKFQFENNSKAILLDFTHHTKGDSIFGYGPFNAGYMSDWVIRKLTNTKMIFETIYQDKKYRVEFEEFEY